MKKIGVVFALALVFVLSGVVSAANYYYEDYRYDNDWDDYYGRDYRYDNDWDDYYGRDYRYDNDWDDYRYYDNDRYYDDFYRRQVDDEIYQVSHSFHSGNTYVFYRSYRYPFLNYEHQIGRSRYYRSYRYDCDDFDDWGYRYRGGSWRWDEDDWDWWERNCRNWRY